VRNRERRGALDELREVRFHGGVGHDGLWAVHRDLLDVETSPLGLSLFQPGRRAWRWK